MTYFERLADSAQFRQLSYWTAVVFAAWLIVIKSPLVDSLLNFSLGGVLPLINLALPPLASIVVAIVSVLLMIWTYLLRLVLVRQRRQYRYDLRMAPVVNGGILYIAPQKISYKKRTYFVPRRLYRPSLNLFVGIWSFIVQKQNFVFDCLEVSSIWLRMEAADFGADIKHICSVIWSGLQNTVAAAWNSVIERRIWKLDFRFTTQVRR